VLDEIGALPPEISVVLPVSPEDAFALLTEPERLRRWKTVSARVDLRAGGSYRWTIIPGHAVRGTFIEVEKGRRLVFGWGWEGSPDLGPDASTVTVTFEPTEGGTLVRLVHTGLSVEQAASHLEGWRHFFDRLAIAAVDGDAGADAWAAVPDPMTDLACAEAAFAVCLRAVRAADAADTAELAEHLAASLDRLGRAAEIEAADPGVEVGAEPRIAAVGQPAFEAWAARDPSETVTFGDAEAQGSLVLAWTAIELLVHAADVAAGGGREPVAEELAAHLRTRADELRAARGVDGEPLAARLLTGPDEDVLRRLDAAVAASGRGRPATQWDERAGAPPRD
jgi:uncharacterized protein YndB with AHSA1/START domain